MQAFFLKYAPVFFVSLSLFISENLLGQTILEELKVTGITNQKFMVGQQIQSVDSAILARFQFTTLAEFLQYQAPISFKSYGSGQATTISFRGTSANHTAVIWNGVNINEPTLGQTDFSTIPLVGFDKMAIQYGSAASVVGTDAVGGSILLSSTPVKEPSSANISLQRASFDNFQEQISLKFNKKLSSSWLFSSKTLVMNSQFNNKFPYTERTDNQGQTYPIEPSETKQKGFIQDIFFQHKNGNLFSLNMWLSDNKLTIQPNNLPFREVTNTSSYRFLAGYDVGNTTLKFGFIRDDLTYGKGDFIIPDKAQTDHYLIKAEHEIRWKHTNTIHSGEISHKINPTIIKIGTDISHYVAQVDGYGQIPKQENRMDLYVLFRQRFSPKIVSSLNIRQAFIETMDNSAYNPPLTPSLGLEYTILHLDKTQLNIAGNINKSYRVPTLNERYWLVLGNPNLNPESGFNKEIGSELKQTFSSRWRSEFRVNLYHNLIDNWIYWNPNKAYHVENLEQVLAKGIETFYSLYHLGSNIKSSISLLYAYTNTSQQKSFDAYSVDIIGKQLPYVPRHVISSNLNINYRESNLLLQGIYNSERFITFDNSGSPFPNYILLNASISTKIKLKKIQTILIFHANNITDSVYPNVKKNAMPGRNYALSLNFRFQ